MNIFLLKSTNFIRNLIYTHLIYNIIWDSLLRFSNLVKLLVNAAIDPIAILVNSKKSSLVLLFLQQFN